MKVFFGIIFISIFGFSQDSWKLMRKADSLLDQGKTFRAARLLKRSGKIKGAICGNVAVSISIEQNRIWGKYYSLKGDTTAALATLLPFVFNNGLASSESLAIFTHQLLLDKYGKDSLKTMYLKALINFSSDDKNETFQSPFIVNFLGQELKYFDWSLQPRKNMALEIRKAIEQQHFSKLILAMN